MSRLRGALGLPVPVEDARAACARALADLGWKVIREEPDLLAAREDPARLPCHHSPAATELTIGQLDLGSEVQIETKVPGFGPISSSHVRGRQEAIIRRIHRFAHAGAAGDGAAGR